MTRVGHVMAILDLLSIYTKTWDILPKLYPPTTVLYYFFLINFAHLQYFNVILISISPSLTYDIFQNPLSFSTTHKTRTHRGLHMTGSRRWRKQILMMVDRLPDEEERGFLCHLDCYAIWNTGIKPFQFMVFKFYGF